MKKNKRINRLIPLLLSIALVISLMPAVVSALPSASMSIKFRIEGISQNLYEQTLVIPYSTPTLTVQAALAYLDTETAGLTLTGVATGFISDINGDASGTFGGWDGWLFMVNSIESPSGIDSTLLNDGDTVLLYYGDPYGTLGMQYPQVDSSRIGSSGILRFTSLDTSYATGSPVTTTNPVVGATVTWYYDSSSASYTTDANGEIVVPVSQRTAGDHRLQIEKYDTTAVSGKYLPLLLRLSSSAKVTVAAAPSSSDSSSSATSSSSSSTSGNPPNGDSSMVLPVIGFILSLSVIAILIKRKRQNNAN